MEGIVLFIRIVLLLLDRIMLLPKSARTVLAWGINMSPPAIVKIDTHPTNTNLLYL